MVTQGFTSRPRSISKLGKYVDEFYDELRHARQEGKMVAWCDGIPIPFPILRAMDIPYVFGDAYAATTSARHLEGRLQQIADDAGYLVEVCSYTRTCMGMAHMSDEERATAHPQYQMPKANFVIVTDPGCSMLVNWGNATREHFGVPMFVIQVPHLWTGEGDREASIVETTRQLGEMVTWLEDITHRKLDWYRLRDIMASVKESAIYRHDALETSKFKPAPATFFDLAATLGGVNYMIGRPECVTYFRDLRDELAYRAGQGIGSVVNEKYRLYWDGIMCWPKFGHLAEKFASYGAAVVAGRYTHYGFYHLPELIDPARPLESMAANLVTMHANQNPEWLIENIAKLCVECSIDGLVMHAHHTCRPLAAPQMEVLEGVSKKLGIPGIFFEADVADESYYSDAQIDTRLQALVETIEAKRRQGR